MFNLGHVLLLTVAAIISLNEVANAEISALEMRQKCRGVEAAIINGDEIAFDTNNHPEVLTCWGAFSTLHQQSLWFDYGGAPIFLPGVCSTVNGHGQKAVVLVRVFSRYV